jgi:4'-phosphopantetheinyl transferase
MTTGSAMGPVTAFSPSPGTITIGPGDVHAWVVDLDRWRAGRMVLDPDERDRSASYLRPQDGARYAVSHAATRVIVSAYLGCDPGRLRFVVSARGQPRVAGHSLQVSLSRSGGVALLALSPDPVGADLECIRPRAGLADLIAARFAAAEAACYASGCAGSPTRSFYRHWVAKEAYLKATGRGLAALRDTELSCGPAPVIRFMGTPEPGWTISVAEPTPGYLAAVVAARPVTAWHSAGPRVPDQRGNRPRPDRHP